MNAANARAVAQTILVAHQRRSAGACLCGWDELGRSHAAHVAEALDRAGVLAEQFATHDDFPLDLPDLEGP